MSETALDESDNPMMATVGPITTGGIILFIHPTPATFTITAITKYTSPANAAPKMMPRYPSEAVDAPAKAAAILPKKAKLLPKNTGLLNFVKSR